jgi:hypothetical protein
MQPSKENVRNFKHASAWIKCCHLLGYRAVYSVARWPPAACWLLALMFFYPKMEVIRSPKRWFTYGLHGPTFQEMAKFKTTAVRDSNSTPNVIGQRSPWCGANISSKMISWSRYYPFLLNPKLHYLFQKRAPLDDNLRQINLRVVHTLTRYFSY